VLGVDVKPGHPLHSYPLANLILPSFFPKSLGHDDDTVLKEHNMFSETIYPLGTTLPLE